ncbi:TPA: GNAT family N-acetyltransferase [bacterium]|nr:GNAT family N-acetyltransferase [bacterium]
MIEITRIPCPTNELIQLVFNFRLLLNKLNKSTQENTFDEAIEETNGYFTVNKQVYSMSLDSRIIGFSVLKIEDTVCWLDYIFIDQEYRNKGYASQLFDYTENVAKIIGSDQLYIWVHPDNNQMLKFLKKKGYNTLNLIEIKKFKENKSISIPILENNFQY